MGEGCRRSSLGLRRRRGLGSIVTSLSAKISVKTVWSQSQPVKSVTALPTAVKFMTVRTYPNHHLHLDHYPPPQRLPSNSCPNHYPQRLSSSTSTS